MWREFNPSYDVSSDDLGYTAAWFVVVCLLALLLSSPMPDLKIDEAVLAWFLVAITAGIVGMIVYLGIMHHKIDKVEVVYISGTETNDTGGRETPAGEPNGAEAKRNVKR